MGSVSNGVCSRVVSEFCMKHATVSLSTGDPSPGYSGLPPGVTVLFFVHMGTCLAQVEFSFILNIDICNFKSLCVHPLESTLIASKRDLAYRRQKMALHHSLLDIAAFEKFWSQQASTGSKIRLQKVNLSFHKIRYVNDIKKLLVIEEMQI